MELELRKEINQIDIPVMFIQGESDPILSLEISRDFEHNLVAPHKEVTMRQGSHRFMRTYLFR